MCPHGYVSICDLLPNRLRQAAGRQNKKASVPKTLAEADRQLVKWTGSEAGARDEISVQWPPSEVFLIVFLYSNTGKLNDMWLQFVKKIQGLLQIRHAAVLPPLFYAHLRGFWLWQEDRKWKTWVKKSKGGKGDWSFFLFDFSVVLLFDSCRTKYFRHYRFQGSFEPLPL